MVYNTLLNALSKSGAFTEALGLYQEMKKEGIAADVSTYTSMIDVLAKSGSVGVVEKALSLLYEIEDEYERTKRWELKPNVRTYTSVITAISRSRKQNPEAAEAVLERMKSKGVEPDTICYNAVLNAWSFSSDKDKASRAVKILEEMLASYEGGSKVVKPDVITCNTIIYSFAFSHAERETERARAMKGAVETLEFFSRKAPEFGVPDHISYGNLLLAITRQMPMNGKRDAFAEAAFRQCCLAGQLAPVIMHRLRLVVSPAKLKELVGVAILRNNGRDFTFDLTKLPKEWRRNAPRGKQRGHIASRGSVRSI
uniref:Pentacotripeptide-repeat region of PRORP domain-containing protein n=1 Tax=Cyclophora tenuis TaxID=216820 RepID=A0A7S1D1N9_CYCTE|mmetsp:Transcript_1895/g.3337  ORF Transcript_1895/g.3337 Transcript_1895/m.3337 type:complete len:312 (+) Transcript_1895:3-938(+)